MNSTHFHFFTLIQDFMKKYIFHKDIKYLFSTHIHDIKNKLMKKIKIENENELTGNDFSN